MTKDEWETTVTWIHTDDVVRIYTAHPKHLARLRADDRATIVRDHGDQAEFTVPAIQFDPLKGFKRKVNMTDEQKAAASARMKQLRDSQLGK